MRKHSLLATIFIVATSLSVPASALANESKGKDLVVEPWGKYRLQLIGERIVMVVIEDLQGPWVYAYTEGLEDDDPYLSINMMHVLGVWHINLNNP